ncbi:MAG: cadherin repeat domain-containing protein [Cyclobacteriaceae bacterium]|nr:cadherin repeat domain-containing protein [Cyclobacteriaceae bacterium]
MSGTAAPILGGDEATFTILDAGDAENFVTVNPITGVITVADESTTGVYDVKIKATNSAGSVEAIAKITVGVNADFNPTDKSYVWKYFINQTANTIMKNLDELDATLPAEITLPVGWPAGWPDISGLTQQELQPYLIFPAVQQLIFQVPGDDACNALNPSQGGDNLNLTVNADLTLSTKCKADLTGSTVDIGSSVISYKDGKYSWTLAMAFQGIPITYTINDPIVANFVDPLDPNILDPSGTPRVFSALQGTVDLFTTPTDFDDANILTSLRQIKVDVVLEVL